MAKRWLQAVVIALFLMVFGVGCVKPLSEEERQALRDQQAAAASAEQRLEELRNQKRGLEGQIRTLEREVQEAEAEKAAVEARWNERNANMGAGQ